MTNSNGHHPPKPLHSLPARPATIIPLASREREQMPGFPPLVAEKIMVFLRSGCSGVVEIQVHQGRIRGGKIIEAFRVDADTGLALDDNSV